MTNGRRKFSAGEKTAILRQRLASYATTETDGDSRAHRDAVDHLRSPFEIDCHRITTCTAFRRLEGKTQVFAAGEHDHFRNRMTHTIEVAAIGRWLARRFQVNETLVEAIAMAHDLGHPPFGHAGEVALNELMYEAGGFNHNTHSVRVVEYLEHPFPTYRGLNLTEATLAGLATHETRYDTPSERETIEQSQDGATTPTAPSVESQIASLADRIAYNCHDLEDGIGAGLLTPADLSRVELWSSAAAELNEHAGDANIHAIRRVVLDRLVDSLLADIVSESQKRLASVTSFEEAMQTNTELVLLSQEMEPLLNGLERFLSDRLYGHPEIARTDQLAREQIGELFNALIADVTNLPERFARRVPEQGAYRVVCDYIAGMTDRFFAGEYDRVV